ncbi:MAG: hypothetical protein HZB51_12840 [Chloroflexi bacterium]|nr:hypothetical protein [Chloroflexota bacterium]
MSTTFEARLKIAGGQASIDTIRSVPRSVSQVGFWSAALATLCSVGYGIALIITMIYMSATATSTSPGWRGIEAFVASFQPIQMLSLIPSLLLAPTFVVLMISLHYYASSDKKIWSHLGIAFALIYAVMASINYIVQLTVVRLSIVNKETDGLAMFVIGNPHSIFWALASCYIFMNLAMLFVAPIFYGGRLERWIRWLFIANGASVVVSIFGVVIDSPAIYLLVSLVSWCIIFSFATALVAVLFKRIGSIAEKL